MIKLDDFKSAEEITVQEALERREAFELYSKDGFTGVEKAIEGIAEVKEFEENTVQELCEKRGVDFVAGETRERMIRYWGSDERVDAAGDIVLQNWNFDEFEKNSPMPWSHSWDAPPIGRVLDWSVRSRSEKDYKGKGLLLDCMFAHKGAWDFADSIFRLVKAGIMTSGSVGFYSDKVIDIRDEDERNELGLGRWGVIFDKNHLLEFSPCTLPCNPGAVVANSLSKILGKIKPKDLHFIREAERRLIYGESKDISRWLQMEECLVRIGRSLWPDENFKIHRELDVPVTLDMIEEVDEVVDVEERSDIENLTLAVNEFRGEVSSSLEDIERRLEVLEDKKLDDDLDEAVNLSTAIEALSGACEKL